MRALTVDQIEDMIRTAMTADDWPTVTDLEQRLNRLHRPPAPPSVLEAALWYAQQGLRVFPLIPRRKRPHGGTNGLLEATTDTAQINAWWRRWPDSNVAIATGHLFDVIDVDGPPGVRAWAEIDGLPPVLGVSSTPRPGGSHLWVAPLGLRNKADLVPGLDYRGDGGYVVAPPSYVVVDEKDKHYEGFYTWRHLLGDTPITTCDEFDPDLCSRCNGPAGEFGWCQPCIDACRAHTVQLDSVGAAAA